MKKLKLTVSMVLAAAAVFTLPFTIPGCPQLNQATKTTVPAAPIQVASVSLAK